MTRRPDGALEHDVLAVLWAADQPLLPGEINERLASGLAYTSVATILTRLHRKGLVTRQPEGRAYAYAPSVDETELAARRIDELLQSTTDRSKVLARFVGGLSPRDAKAIRTLLSKDRK